jgi:hypothetical protein
MSKLISLVGQKFGRLTVLKRSEITRSSGALWECECECGGTAIADSLKLRTGHTRSCGCLKVEARPNLQHGLANKSSTYRSWKEMRQRCMNSNSDKWQWYGGRGIRICPEWDSYERFLADMGERPLKTTIDRINPDGNYEPTNCRWATAKQQAETNRGVIKPGSVPVNRTSDRDLAKMREMRAAGMKLREIAEHFGKQISVISTLINHGRNGPKRSL